MKTEEKTSKGEFAQVVFRPSAECRGYYRFHYGHLTSDGTFFENSEQDFFEFLEFVGVPAGLVSSFAGNFSDSELEVCGFGYLLQERFDEFLRCFVGSCGTVQLYPGMLAVTFNKKENEDW